MKPIKTIDDPRYVKALSHPLRVRILGVLEERTASPVELADLLGASLGVVSYHVRRLHQLGLLELKKETRRRGAIEHHYRAKERPRVSDEAWGKASPMAKQAMVGAMLEQFNHYASRSAAAGGFDRADAHITRNTMRVDAKGWDQLSKACWKLLEQAQKIEQAAAKRIEGSAHSDDVIDVGLITLLFEGVRLSEQQERSGRSPARGRVGRRAPEAARERGAEALAEPGP
jgi:DNA-binding transcriptional ArsR family regulator